MTINYLPSWKNAKDPSDPNLPAVDAAIAAVTQPRTFGVDDGSHNFSTIKYLNRSGLHYLYACNTPTEPSRAMLIGTAVHRIVLGPRPGSKNVCCFPGARRAGKEWDAFSAANHDAEILTLTEWEEAEAVARAVMEHPVARERLSGARCEVPLKWEENGIRFSTSGVDIVSADGEALDDLKTTTSVEPEALQRQCLKMLYPQQMAFYRRGARANGMPVTRGLFLDCVEVKPPYDFVSLKMSDGMIDLAERSVSLWLERLHVFKESNEWPGFAQSPVPFEVPAWMQSEEEDDE